jgi:glycerate 2-kinase
VKFVIIPDSFKGTLSSIDVCNIIENEIFNQFKNATMIKVPVADGGEGSVDAFLEAVGGKKVYLTASGPYFEPIETFYGLIDQGKTAIIEMAACAGLLLVGSKSNPSLTTTYGVGEMISHALNLGVTKIIMGLGGSATNDGGTGCAAALGVQFLNEFNQSFIPVGGTLSRIKQIDMTKLDQRLKKIDLITMCDIDNPLYGTFGAAYIFGPQKGADKEMVDFLDHNLVALANIVSFSLSIHDVNFNGAGSAGGMGFGMKVFFDSKIEMGIETVLNQVGFDHLIKDVNYIITGEGKLDDQSLRGKVVIGIARRSKDVKAKKIAIVGSMVGNKIDYLSEGLDEIYITNIHNKSFEEVKKTAENDLRNAVNRMIQDIKKSLN